MSITKNKMNSNRKWNEENLDRLYVTVSRGNKEIIKAHAVARGESLNGFVTRAITEAMERDKQGNRTGN